MKLFFKKVLARLLEKALNIGLPIILLGVGKMAVNITEYAVIFNDPMFNQIIFAVFVVALGLVLAKVSGKLMLRLNKSLKVESNRSIKSFVRILELFIFLVSLIAALSVLRVSVAEVIVLRVWEVIPSVIVLFLLLLLGYIIINLVVDIFRSIFLRLGSAEYLKEIGISKELIQNIFFILKLFLLLILISVSFSYVGFAVPYLEHILTALIYGFIFLSIAVLYYAFKDYLANFFLASYVEKNVLKPGQSVKVGEDLGEVVSVTSHGAVIKMPTGFNLLIPNKEVVKKKVYFRRVREDIFKLESIRARFVSQLPSYCGPASLQMMLSFFGYNFDQEKIGKMCETHVPGGTEPEEMIETVKKLTRGSVKGHTIQFAQIYNLKEEVKSWIAEGALVVVWYKKPVLFPDKPSQSGHYVLCVGVEGDELVVMDSSPQTAGVYMIDYRLLEDAMDYYDKMRGYIVFAKKGTPAFWRLGEGLIYSEASAYKDLSKSFERYLKKTLRKKAMIPSIISEHLSPLIHDEKMLKRVWKPDLTQSKAKQEQEKNDLEKKPSQKAGK